VLLSTLHTFLFAAFPIVGVVAANAGFYPIPGPIVARALLVAIGGTALALWGLRALRWPLAARAAWLSVFLLAANHYSLIPVPSLFAGRGNTATGWFALAFIALAALLSAALVRPWRRRPFDPVPLLILAVVLLVASVYPAVSNLPKPVGSWQSAADSLTAPAVEERINSSPERDVYIIVLDAFGRADVLGDLYGVDLGTFVGALESEGFYVPRASRSNYSQTFLALASMLNMDYLDPVTEALGAAARDRRPLRHLIEHNALMRLAGHQGYTVVGVASDYTATESFPAADVCYCRLPSPHEFDHSALGRLPARDLGLEQWIAAGRRKHVEYAFDSIEAASHLSGRKFVVAHVVTPHPPFVFDRSGEVRTPPDEAPFILGEWLPREERSAPAFASEYRRGYAEQTLFVAARVRKLIAFLLAQPGPTPAIAVLGDHGPALMLDLRDPKGTDMHERMSVFSAYLLPGAVGSPLYEEISPVNGMRAIADRYLGVRVPFRSERSLFSTFPAPYRFVEIPAGQ
jgi:hypothetical protein